VFVFLKAPTGVLSHVLRVPLDPPQEPSWESRDATLLPVDGADVWTATMVAAVESHPPALIIKSMSGYELRVVDPRGRSWSTDPDALAGPLRADPDEPFRPLGPVRAAVRTGDRLWLLVGRYDDPVERLNAYRFGFTEDPENPNAPGRWWDVATAFETNVIVEWLGSQYFAKHDRLVAYSRTGGDQVRATVIDLTPPGTVRVTQAMSPTLDGTRAWSLSAAMAGAPHLVACEVPWSDLDTPLSPRPEHRLVPIRMNEPGQVELVPVTGARVPHLRLLPLLTRTFPATADLHGADAEQRAQLEAITELNGDSPITSWTYLDEAYYLLPLQLALELHRRGSFEAALRRFRAIYDYAAAPDRRITYPLLDRGSGAYVRLPDWLNDPFDVHGIAATRPGTDARAVALFLVRCLLDFADTEFTIDTGEAIVRAELLYLQALTLLDDLLRAPADACAEIVGGLTLGPESPPPEWQEVVDQLRPIRDLRLLRQVVADLEEILTQTRPWPERIAQARARVAAAIAQQTSTGRTLKERLREEALLRAKEHRDLMRDPIVEAGLEHLDELADDGDPGATPSLRRTFCTPPNPVPTALRLRAELNLHKIRTCRDIAGLERVVEPSAASADGARSLPAIGSAGQQIGLPGVMRLPATPYRYRTLIERARQLTALAQQMEASFLSTLEKAEAAELDLLRARQQVDLARGAVHLQNLRIQEAQHGVDLADLQQQRANIQADHFATLLKEGLLDEETWALNLVWATMWAQFGVAAAKSAGLVLAGAGADAASFLVDAGLTAGLATAGGAVIAMVADATVQQSVVGGMSSWSAALATIARQKRLEQDWQLQLDLARKDQELGHAQAVLAQDRVSIVGQERAIAAMQADHADEVVTFLDSRFAGAELYHWMSGVLEGVYRYQLQQATAVTRLAEAQLAFERQETPTGIVLADYGDAPRDPAGSSVDGTGPDRRGMTGSARLLQDLTRLDQYAFETDRRKLQLSRTVSLAQLDPFAFQRFRETGVLIFATPSELFDRDFPGHYLRLIRQVRTSVIALIPPTIGIRATLSTSGVSRVTIGGDVFQTTLVQRPPESVALCAPMNASGVLELQPQGEMLLPFEGLGVDTTWEFRMPRPANSIDYRSIADILITIDYTALDSPLYRQDVIRRLDPVSGGDRPFSLRRQFPDQWYDLHHPEGSGAGPVSVRFRTEPQDFPANLSELAIRNVLLYFVRGQGATFEVPVEHLLFTETGTDGPIGGPGQSVNGLISAATANAAGWARMLGRSPAGAWELALASSGELAERLGRGEIEDILLVLSYEGRHESWPA